VGTEGGEEWARGSLLRYLKGREREYERYRTESSSRLAQKREKNLRSVVFLMDMPFFACDNARDVNEVRDMR
jgi:hypothetical protein